MSRFVPTFSLGGEFTRAAGTERLTGQRGASVSEWQSKELSPQEFTICIVTISIKRQSESCTDSGHASIAGGSPEPSKLAPTMPARGVPRDPLASLAEEDDNKVCLPAKRQPISTLGIGTVYTPFGSLQEKVRRQSAGTAHFDGQRSPCLRDYCQTRQWSHKSRFSKVRVS